MERGAVCDDDIIAAVGGGIPDWLVFAHEDDGDAGGETPKRRGFEKGRVGGGEGPDGGEGLVRGVG
jgi:hypothetical protein